MNSRVRREQIEWRRDKILSLAADGYSIREIESILKIPHSTIHLDLVFLRKQAKEEIRKYVEDRVPFEFHKTLAGLEGIIKNMSKIIADDSTDKREVMQATAIKMQAYNMKMEMVSNANLVYEAIELVEKYRDYTTQNKEVRKDGNASPA